MTTRLLQYAIFCVPFDDTTDDVRAMSAPVLSGLLGVAPGMKKAAQCTSQDETG